MIQSTNQFFVKRIRLVLLSFLLFFTVSSNNLFSEVFLISELDLNPRNSSLRHSDIAFSEHHSSLFSNPASISRLDNISAGFTYTKDFADVSLTTLSSVYPLKNKFGTVGLTLAYLNLGEFEDVEDDYKLYTAYDMMIVGSYGYNVYENLYVGTNLRFLQSKIDKYTSNGVSIDLSGLYLLMDEKLRLATGIFNVGSQLDTYNDGINEDLPTEVRLGISNILDRIPLEVGLQYSYSLNNESTYGIGLEFIPKKFFKIRAGYDFRAESRKFGTGAKLEKFAGISLGTEIDIKNFGFDFSYSIDGELEAKFSLATTYYFNLANVKNKNIKSESKDTDDTNKRKRRRRK